jgi:serine/threonine protein kinase
VETNSTKEIYKNIHPWSRPNEIWSVGAVIYTMMTGMPPPRHYNYVWQISRMNDKGFTKGLRDIVAKMIHPVIGKRPDTLSLVGLVEIEWRSWRGNTAEGRAYIDGGDERLRRLYEREKPRELPSWEFI